MFNPFAIPLLAFALVTAPAPDGPATVDVQRYTLDNGIRVLQVHAPGARLQTVFTVLPLTLANDDAHRAQWSHLLEHMVMRTTDPEPLLIEGIQVNGETMHSMMRLEAVAAAPRWREALDRHARWVAARRFTSESLAREKTMIRGEERATAMRNATAKFAVAAWNQVVRHGLDHATVHGDIAGATLDDVHAYADARLPVDDSVLVATVGPAPADEVRAAIEAEFGAIERDRVARPELPAKPRTGTVEATWDFPDRHLLMWWRLPDGPKLRAAASIAGQMCAMAVSFESSVNESVIQGVYFPVVATGDATYALADLVVSDDADRDEITGALQNRLKQLVDGTGADPIVRSATFQAKLFEGPPNFEAMARQMPEGQRPLAPTQWLLTHVLMLSELGAPDGDAAAALLAGIEAADVEPVIGTLAGPPTGVLDLRPGGSDDPAGNTGS